MTERIDAAAPGEPGTTVPAPRRWLRELLLGGIVGGILGVMREASSSVGPLPPGFEVTVLGTFGLGVVAIVGLLSLLTGSRRTGLGLLLVAGVAFAVFQVLGLIFNAL